MNCSGGEGSMRVWFSWSHSRLFYIIAFMAMAIFLPAADASGQQLDFTTDFEDGTLRGWTAEGNAFRNQPTLGDNPTARDRGQAAHLQGKYWIGTYERYQGKPGQKAGEVQEDRPTGTLTSAAFVIPKGTLSFLIGGGSSFETRVELVIGEPLEGFNRVRHATGSNTETMHRESWDLTPYAEKTGRLRIVDASSSAWGHINADDFRFLPGQEGPLSFHGLNTVKPVLQATVPDVTGLSFDEASARIVKNRLLAEQSGSVASSRVKGTVVKQSPGPGTAVPVDSKVRIWLAQGVEPPALKAEIIPEHLELTQGEEAAFVSGSSSPERSVREEWSGPDNRSGSGRRFVVSTESLSPGTYPIRLSVTDNTERSSRAVATLVVRSRPEVRYHLKARVVPEAISAGEAVRASAVLDRAVADVEYGFDFGDGTAFVQSRTTEVMHTYAAPGEFSVIVFARIREKIIAQSDRIKVTVKRKVPALTVTLKADRQSAKTGEEVIFRAQTGRQGEGIRYRFVFGDLAESDWRGSSEIGHAYRKKGSYGAVVQVKAAGEDMIESAPVTIAVESPPEAVYTVQLLADSDRIQPDGEILFTAVLQPPEQTARYSFIYGDRNRSDWLPVGQSAHRYAEPGEYTATVAVRKEGRIVAESEPVPITVVMTPPPDTSAGKTVPANLPTAVTAILFFSAGYFLQSWRRKQNTFKYEPVISFTTSLHQDSGEQMIGAVQRLDLEYALHLLWVADPGRQEVVSDGSPIVDETTKGGGRDE